MDVNADFSQRVLLHGAQLPWVDSPIVGVQRRMLDRIGDEVARATSIVRYAPGSQFSPHTHSGGEEFIVLEGVFSDEHGDFPAGCYVRNPPGSRHTPGSAEGCVIFVKLWQFDAADRSAVIIDMNKIGRVRDPERVGIAVSPLFEDERETVELRHYQPNAKGTDVFPEGAELLVLRGSLDALGESLQPMSWLRIPCGGQLSAAAGAAGAQVWLKQRHLRNACAPAL
jgi:quercetin dioxygenase-like cupin family protein